MKYSIKTLLTALLLLFLSVAALGTMYLPLENDKNSFEIMESTFNSLRKGITPPFEELNAANRDNLGKSFTANLSFSNRKIFEAATRILLRNKLMVTPKGRTLKVQGDLGYTLKYLMNDVRQLYFNQNKKLENKYGMSATQSMFVVDRILKKLAISMKSKRMTAQEQLTSKIRLEALIPAYNLRNALPIHINSGFTYLSIGTFVLLMLTLVWDLANLLFFRTVTDVSFLKKMSGAEKIENKAAFIKKQKARKKKAAALAKKAAAAAEEAKTGKDDPANKKVVKNKKPVTDVPKSAAPKQSATKPASPKDDSKKPARNKAKEKSPEQKTAVKKSSESAAKKDGPPKQVAPELKRKKTIATTADNNPAKPVKKPASPKKAQVAPPKKTQPTASQKTSEKVIPPAGNKKGAAKPTPAKPKRTAPKAVKAAEPAAATKKPVPKTVKTKD